MRYTWMAVLALLAGGARAQDQGFTGGFEVLLRDATWVRDDRQSRSNMVLMFEAENGKWNRVYGRGLNIGDHFGFVQEAQVTADAVRVSLPVRVAADDWIPGGPATYQIELKRDAAGKLKGTWKGTFRDEPLSGDAYGHMRPPRLVRLKNFVPLQPGEHPRLLFRKHELPALKEKLKTPLGEAFLAQAKAAVAAPVCQGMLWQLTGEKQYADRAREIVGGYNDLAPEGTGTGSVGHRFVAVALTADLCWDVWPESFRKELSERMLNDLSVIQRRLQIAGANFNPCSNFYGPARGSAAIATLLFYGLKGPEPRKPLPPDELVAKGDLSAKLIARSGKLEQYKKEYPSLLARWQVQHGEWQAMGGADLEVTELFHKGFWHMNRHYQVGIGEGGFAAETGVYSAIAPRYPLFYATYYLRCFGRNPTPYPDITHHMSRRLMQCLFPADEPKDPKGRFREREPIAPKINSIAGFTYGGLEWLAGSFPLTPDEHKPALLWAWNYMRGVRPDDPQSVVNILPEAGETGTYLAHAFINYPLDMKPGHPRDVMPLNWVARTMGLYLSRSGWNGTDDFLSQVFIKAHPIGGWNHPNAGTFSLFGLGHDWATTNPDRLGFRLQENVVLLPDDKINGGASGYAAHWETLRDGSSTLTADLRDLYGTAKTAPKTRKPPDALAGGIEVQTEAENPERTLPVRDSFNDRIPENWADSGINGLRAFGFDYSGRSGAPCLMVVVDRITGGKKKVWTWHVERDSAKIKSEKGDVAIDGNSFTLKRGDAFLRATFVSPAKVKIVRQREEVKMWSGTSYTSRAFEGFLDRVEAVGDDPTSGEFLVVVTVQRKDAPAVTYEGKGLEATVRVGGQRVRFDGQKVRFGEGG